MKKAKFITSLTLILCLSGLMVYGQNLSPKQVKSKIVKSWTATEVGNPGEAMIPKNNKEVMDFKADGTLHMEQESKMMGTMAFEAQWIFDKKKQRLIMTIGMDDRKETQELEIIELTDTRLVLVSPAKQSAYIPSDMVVEQEKAPVEIVAAAGGNHEEMSTSGEAMNPDSWSGQLEYNTVFVGSNNTDVEEEMSGVITLSMVDGKKVITKIENGKTIIWTIASDMEIAGITRYSAECSDAELTGEITFQNNGLLLEMYKPEYASLFFISK